MPVHNPSDTTETHVKKRAALPKELVTEIETLLADPFTGKPPKGAWGEFNTKALQHYLRHIKSTAQQNLDSL